MTAVVALVALFVALAAAALAAFVFRFLLELKKRVDELEMRTLEHRFAPPADSTVPVFLPEVPAALDVSGAWAMEEERAGRPVSEEVLAAQRRMRLEAGL